MIPWLRRLFGEEAYQQGYADAVAQTQWVLREMQARIASCAYTPAEYAAAAALAEGERTIGRACRPEHGAAV